MFSRVVRQTHMYVGLFLMPWILMYALSTLVMNHRAAFKEHYGGSLVRWVKEDERRYTGQFAGQTEPKVMAEQILRELRLEGNFAANMAKNGARLTINRTDPLTPRRITYTSTDNKLVIEKQEFRAQPFLESLHRRRGYNNRYSVDTAWAVSVDVATIGILLWVASGVWMWWELKLTRRTGAMCIAAGLALFALFTFTL